MGSFTCDTVRCVLGTAQLGLSYGIANTTGQPGTEEAVSIVGAALAAGIDCFDTARGYGESEHVLGLALARNAACARARVITKLPPALPESSESVEEAVRDSLRTLGVPSLHALLLHREEQLPLLDGALGRTLHLCRERGMTARLGISVYTPTMALAALRHPLVDVVQLPSSVLDRRFAAAGVFDLALRQGKEVHVRSALLQGVLCMEPGLLPVHLRPLIPSLRTVRAVCAAHGVTAQQCALAWILHKFPAARLLFGAETVSQIHENASLAHAWRTFPASLYTALDAVQVPQAPVLLNPALWGKST